jgi:hypothetical protein
LLPFFASQIEYAAMNSTINTGGADAGIQRKNVLAKANMENKKITTNTFRSSLCII